MTSMYIRLLKEEKTLKLTIDLLSPQGLLGTMFFEQNFEQIRHQNLPLLFCPQSD